MISSLFYKIFPTPEFLTMHATGLDISDEAVRTISLKKGETGLEIESFREIPLTDGIISSGEIKNPEKLRSVFRSLNKEQGIIFVRVSLPEEKAYIVRVKAPVTSTDEIRGNLELQLEEQVPIPVEEAVFDYDIIAKHEDNFEVALSVLPRSVVTSYLNLFDGTGIIPLSFEIESQAIAKCVIPRGEMGTSMIIDMEQKKMSMSIVSDGIVRFTSSFSMGSSTLNEAIAKNLKIDIKDADVIRTTTGISAKENDQGLFVAMVPTLAIMRDEINRHFIYWHTHEDQYGKDHPKIEQLFLCGSGAATPGLADHFAVGLKVPIKLANVMANVNPLEKYIPDIKYVESFKYTTAIGLALK
ncbi:MAG TPA: hypothetical protein ENI61_02490 [Ignavibacteria bacterium]|nr:hypothetical protein [Ignavibacteria bacterium]